MFDHAATYVFWEGVNSINNEQKTNPLCNDCTWLYFIVASNNNNKSHIRMRCNLCRRFLGACVSFLIDICCNFLYMDNNATLLTSVGLA